MVSDTPPQGEAESDREYAARVIYARALDRVQRERREGEGWLEQLRRQLGGMSEELALAIVGETVLATRGNPSREFAVQDAYGMGIELGLAIAREREADASSAAGEISPAAPRPG